MHSNSNTTTSNVHNNHMVDSNNLLVSRVLTEERQERKTVTTEFIHNIRIKGNDGVATNGHYHNQEGNTLTDCSDTSIETNSSPILNGISSRLKTTSINITEGNGSLSRTLKQQTTNQQETKVKQIVSSFRMGPDGPDRGQPMEYTGVRPNNQDYVQPGFGTNSRQQPQYQQQQANPDHIPYDPALLADPTYYVRGPLIADSSGRRYQTMGSYDDFDQYPEYPNYPEHGIGRQQEPSASFPHLTTPPSERSDSPRTHPAHRLYNSDYIRQGYPPQGYEELDSGVAPRPEYLVNASNAPGNYGDEELTGVLGNNASTSHYGNLPVRPYLLSGGTINENTNDNHSVPNAMLMGGEPSSPPRLQQLQLSPSTSHYPPYNRQHSHLHQEDDLNSQMMDANLMMNNNSVMFPSGSGGVRWRDPDLHEVIQFLGNPNPVVKANAAAYLQHLCYMDDPVKSRTRTLGGIPPLVALLSHDQPEVNRNACGALRNLSYGRQNDENKKAIKSAGGIPSLIRLLKRTPDSEVKELVTGVLWNLSSCEELKKAIIDDAIVQLVNMVVIPHSGWERSTGGSGHIPDACWTTVFKNASGVLRNVSSAGEYARKKLRECEGLVEALLHVIRCALSRADIDDKSVENGVCILRNLSYRCQEVEDPNYDKHPPPVQSRATAIGNTKGDNLGCFGANKKKKEAAASSPKGDGNNSNQSNSTTGLPSRNASLNKNDPIRGMELLWQPEVVQAYLALLSNCSNPETLEAAAGAIQNLAACYWQPSIEIRAAVRKEKGLPVLVELLRMEVDRVVCAVATALRNLALDQRNKELIGKYAMRDLVQKLPSGRAQDQATSDDTIAAVLATLNEVIKKNAEFSRSLMEAEGVERLVLLTQQKRRYSPRVVKFASQVLYSMWQHQELREVYKKAGWTEQDFISKSGVRGGSPGPSGMNESAGSPVNANSTLNRPMASQSGTRYEDKTMPRISGNNSLPKSPAANYATQREDNVPMADMKYPDENSHTPAASYRMYQTQMVKPGEPLYAQVNREKKKNRSYDGVVVGGNGNTLRGYHSTTTDHSHWPPESNNTNSVDNLGSQHNQPAGDSWV